MNRSAAHPSPAGRAVRIVLLAATLVALAACCPPALLGSAGTARASDAPTAAGAATDRTSDPTTDRGGEGGEEGGEEGGGEGGGEGGAPSDATAWSGAVHDDLGFTTVVPDGHMLARASGGWFVHGFLEEDRDAGGDAGSDAGDDAGEEGGARTPLVPDVRLVWLSGQDPDGFVRESLPEDARTEIHVLGPGTTAWQVTATYRLPDDTPYAEDVWLFPHPDGTMLIARYESFDWSGFDRVVASFRWTRPARTHGSAVP